MGTITVDQKVANAIKWINALDPKRGFKKTTYQLGVRLSKPMNSKVDTKKDMSYCCLGVGCRVLKLETDYEQTCSSEFADSVGLKDVTGGFYQKKKKNNRSFTIEAQLDAPIERKDGNYSVPTTSLVTLNDDIYHEDRNFKNIHKFILRNLRYIFIPSVAKGLKEHFGS